MNIIIQPSTINGEMIANSSKSYMQRALACSLLAKGVSVLENPSRCNDSMSAYHIIENLGATITDNGDNLVICGGLSPKSDVLDVGESGLGIRMFTPIAALNSVNLQLIGKGSLSERPIDMMLNPLKSLGAKISTNNGFVPISVCGPLKGGVTEIDGSISSQFLTGLLLALPLADNYSVLHVKNLKSKPYIDMTLSILEKFGIEITNANYELFHINGQQQFKPTRFSVEADWSGVAFMLVAGAVAGMVKVKNVSSNSKQADVAIMDALRKVGADVICDNNEITVSKNCLKSFEFDATECPDLFPPLVTLAANCKGKSIIKGTGRLIHKESNRANVLQNEFRKLNVKIELEDDVMMVHGGSISGGIVNSHNDHRIAMAGAIAALTATDSVTIENFECINKSYPTFFDDLKSIGGHIYE